MKKAKKQEKKNTTKKAPQRAGVAGRGMPSGGKMEKKATGSPRKPKARATKGRTRSPGSGGK